jgi:hypothetical protein
MHPDIARELMNQRNREMVAQARHDSLARQLRAALRARRHGQQQVELPVIPDYVPDLVADPGIPAQRRDTTTTTR